MKIFFYDLETTGLDLRENAIVQIAGIIADLDTDGTLKPVDAINLKMQPAPGKKVSLGAFEVNGLDVETVKSFPQQDVQFKKLLKFLDRHVDRFNKLDKLRLAGYNNSRFDNDFLRQWFLDNNDSYFGSYFWNDGLDVMCEASRYLFHYRPILTNFSLGNIGNVLGIIGSNEGLHDGLYDIKLTFKVFKKILESGQLIMPFDEEVATKIFKQQQETKEMFIKKPIDMSNDKVIVWS